MTPLGATLWNKVEFPMDTQATHTPNLDMVGPVRSKTTRVALACSTPVQESYRDRNEQEATVSPEKINRKTWDAVELKTGGHPVATAANRGLGAPRQPATGKRIKTVDSKRKT